MLLLHITGELAQQVHEGGALVVLVGGVGGASLPGGGEGFGEGGAGGVEVCLADRLVSAPEKVPFEPDIVLSAAENRRSNPAPFRNSAPPFTKGTARLAKPSARKTRSPRRNPETSAYEK